MSNPEGEASSATSAKFLQARITALSTTLIKRLENIFAAALEEDIPSHHRSDTAVNPPSLTDTAVKQLQIDVESTALIRAAEELMMLTRSLKELWLFGGLDTIPTGDARFGISAEERRRIEVDEDIVVRGLKAYFGGLGQVDENREHVNGTATASDTHT